jgi:acyl-CoA thioester hydrolase
MTELPTEFSGRAHVFPVRVYYEDTDSGGVVYYANYLKMAERARTEMMRGCGLEHGRLLADYGALFAVRRCEVEYLRPARLDDALEVHSSIAEARRASFWLDQTVRRDGVDLVRLKVQLVCVSREGRAVGLPPPIIAALRPFS